MIMVESIGCISDILRHQNKASESWMLLRRCSGIFQIISQYACTDADTFIEKDDHYFNTIKPRLDDYHNNPERMRANHSANMLSTIQFRTNKISSTLESIANKTHAARAGCCTTLACTTAYELIKQNHSNIHIEVVAHAGRVKHSQTHCFVLVGRKLNSQILTPHSWGSDAFIVDLWAATIGCRHISQPLSPAIKNLYPPNSILFSNK